MKGYLVFRKCPKGCNQPGARAAEIQLHEQAPKTRSHHITGKKAKRGPD